MKIGLASVTFRQLSIDEILSVSNGLDVIEWGGDIHIKPNEISLAKNVYKQTINNGQKIFSYGSYYKLLCGMNFDDILQTAVSLKSKLIRIWVGEQSGKNIDNDIIKKASNELAEIAMKSKKYNIKIGLEYHPNTLTDNYITTKKLLQTANKDNIFTYWQPNPNLTIHEHLIEIEELRDYICSIHVFHWTDGKRCLLSDGFEVWRSYLNLLNNKDIPLILEFVKNDNIENFRKDVTTLKKLIESL